MSRCSSLPLPRTVSAVFTACLLTFAASAVADDWPGFRGKDGTGTAQGTSVFSGTNGFRLKTVWKKTIGSGYSGVAIADNHVVTMFSDGKSDVAAAFDEGSGKELWRFEIGPTYEGHDGSHTGPISTPLIAGGHVFGLSAQGRLFALDLATGNLQWSTHLVDDLKVEKPYYGFGTSPIMMDGTLVVELGGENQAVGGFDPATGKKLWSSGNDKISYQSPIHYAFGGEERILSPGEEKLLLIDPQGGSVLWEYGHGGKGATGAGSLVPVPVGDNRLFLAFKPDAATVIELTKGDSGTEAKPLWEDRCIRNSYNVPVYRDGYVYAFSSRFLTCVDAATGEAKWKSRQPGDGFLILVDKYLVLITKAGSVHVANADPGGYDELAHLELFSDLAWSPPSFANDHIFVRSLGEIAKVAIVPGAVEVAESGRDPLLTGTKFGYFLSEVAKADDKAAVVDRFMAAQKQFPIIEGNSLVHFVYRGPADDVALAGDMIGARQERPMNHVDGTDLWYFSMRLEPDARVNYMFVKDYAETVDPLNPRKTTTSVYGKEMEMSFGDEEMDMSWVSMPKWEMPEHLAGAKAAAHGKIESHEFESDVLKEGETPKKVSLDVYLPPGYETGDARYPVAYIHGGGAAREKGMYTEMLDLQIGKRVRPVIVVFIKFRQGPRGEGYGDMVTKELIPYVDEHFRTIPSRDARAHVGVSFTAYQAMLCAFQHPDLASKLAVQSPLLFGGMKTAVEASIPSPDKTPMTIYHDWGTYDLRNPQENWDMADENRAFAKLLEEKGYKAAGGEVHDGTGWSSWRNRVDRIFETLFPLTSQG